MGLDVPVFDHRHLSRGRDQVVHERRGERVASVVIGHLFEQCAADPLHHATGDLALDDHRVDHDPAVLADDVTGKADLSGGRVDLGIGVGWLEEEFRAVNVPWPQRGRRTDEYLDVLATLWTDETSQFEGEFYSLNPCQMFPKPVQSPLPIHIGGESDAALKRVARAGHGWHTFNRAPEDLAEPLARLDVLLAEEGRSRADIAVTVCPYFKPLDADATARYAEAGADAVSALIIPMDVDSVRTQLDDLIAVQERAASM